MALRVEPWIESLELAKVRPSERGLFRSSARDAVVLTAALLQGALLVGALVWLAPRGLAGGLATAAFIAVGMAWASNTVSHIHLHTPLFHSRWLNRALCTWLTASLGIPQTLWRQRHLWHHAGEPAQPRRRPISRRILGELLLVVAIMACIAALAPRVFVFAYLPGYLLGLALCRLQGDMEHAASGDPKVGTSHYGRWHNVLWFNDGYHAEHHAFPTEHWSRLPSRRARVAAIESSLPPLTRALEHVGPWLRARVGAGVATFLCALERVALASGALQHFMLATHLTAFRRVLSALPRTPRTVTIVGGGLFPRTALVLAQVFPEARLRVVDRSAGSIRAAREYLAGLADAPALSFECSDFDPSRHSADDLVVVPLAFVGQNALKDAVARRTALLTHDWIWTLRSPRTAIVSPLLLKRVSLSVPGRAARLDSADSMR
ncbi:MAG TPA: fatty acid desaturase [Polyangiaceae bacterium]|nr:fatty acid desaturase [Polyangiaceae bacterium]HMR78581.1 fatty acid desaturase [Polyangiaceae bacterium]